MSILRYKSESDVPAHLQAGLRSALSVDGAAGRATRVPRKQERGAEAQGAGSGDSQGMGSAEGWIMMPYPVSANRYWRNFNGRMVLSCQATKYKRSVGATYAVEGGKYHHNISVEVAIRLHPKLTKNGLPSKTRIDLDNCLKVVLDALNNVAYRDDSQIVKIVAEIAGPVVGGALSVRVKGAA